MHLFMDLFYLFKKQNRKLYFCQQSLIGRCNYDGTEYEILYEDKDSNPASVVVHNGYIYWLGM